MRVPVEVEVPVEVYRPMPSELTSPIDYPAPFGDAVTVELLIDRIFQMYDKLDRANSDRATVKRLTQPEDPADDG